MEYKKALLKCMQMCSRKEYCIFDIANKLENWDVESENIEKVISALLAEKFINEERFVKAFVNDKFIFNHWGKIKIGYHLKHKQIDNALIEKGLGVIDDDEYMRVVVTEIGKKIKKVKANSTFERNAKVANYMASKGFESDLVFDILKRKE